MLSKLSSVQRRVKTFQQQPQHFHLDEEQQQVAFEAKKQLEECSQEILEEFQSTKKISYKSDSSATHHLRQSALTKATENEGKTILSKRRYRSRKESQCPKCRSLSKKSIKQQEQSPKKNKKNLSGMINSINLEDNFKSFSGHCDQTPKFRLLNKIQIYRQKILRKSGFSGITFRSHSIEAEPAKGSKMTRLHSSKKGRAKMSFGQEDQVATGRPYSFNDTMSGIKFSQLAKKNDHCQKNFFEPEGVMRPVSCRGPGVSLRPEFLRLILKIKQKQQVLYNKKMTEKRIKLKK